MPVLQQIPINEYTASGSGTVFPYTFKVPDEESLKVFIDEVLQPSGYVISDIDNNLGGNVTFTVPPPEDSIVRLERSIALVRETDYIEGGPLPAAVLDGDFDRLVMMVQELDATTLRAQGGSGTDAFGRRITNVGTPIDPTDAVTKGWAETTGGSFVADALVHRNAAEDARDLAEDQAESAIDSASAATAAMVGASGFRELTEDFADAAAVSAAAALASEVAATASEAAAAVSETNAAASEAAVAASAAEAALSETNAVASEVAAATSAAEALDHMDDAAASAAAAAAAAGSIDTSQLVQLTGTQTVTGAKTFNDLTVVTEAVDTSTTKVASTAFADRFRSLKLISTGATTATTAGRGALYDATGGITVPNAVFAAGDTFTIYNDTASNLTITQGASLTLRLVGTATTGNRTLAQRGLATVVFLSSSEAVISGGGLS
ncbi:MAG: hypothetical protein Q7V53_07240 [Caldisericota bacterium]|nr:hypothetical protein [Caldisericota bacterium]